ncbi:lysostaphin resistance A-like protein [Hymenobacter coalescens]
MSPLSIAEPRPARVRRRLHPVAGFALLAAPYHAAEYAMRFHQHVPLFLGLLLACVGVAYAVARGQGYTGLSAWGLGGGRRGAALLGLGLLLGLLAHALAFAGRLGLGIETVQRWPPPAALGQGLLLFGLGTFLPSLAEDILTRGYLLRHLPARLPAAAFVLLSAAVYVLNHVYALGSGPTQLTYLFVLGVGFAVPLVITRNLWYTVGAHWGGNILYRLSHDVLRVTDGPHDFSGLWQLTLCMALMIPVHFMVARALQRRLGSRRFSS